MTRVVRAQGTRTHSKRAASSASRHSTPSWSPELKESVVGSGGKLNSTSTREIFGNIIRTVLIG